MKIVDLNKELTKIERKSIMGGNKWTDFYETEKDLIEGLRNIDLDIFDFEKTNIPLVNCGIKGYGYIIPFCKKVQEGAELTTRQITQAKRLACQIKLAEIKSKIYRLK